jgi:putative membrane protein
MDTLLSADNKVSRIFFRKVIPAYAYALHNHLMKEQTRIELFEEEEYKALFAGIDHKKHVPNQVALLMYRHVQLLYQEKALTGEQLLFINAELQSFTDVCGACERIKNTPIPFSYSIFLKKFIFFYIMTLPFGYVFQLGYYIIPVVAFIFYVLASLELIAEEIEDPFSGDQNDVPTGLIAQNIHRNVAELI